ncbi:glycosyltransferase [Zemynaea arenosa]|nr:glycosyltransferase [Massilia arenosa]
MKRVLMIAYHFPPLRGSSGIQRTLKFAQYLPQAGWLPLVLSAHPRAYQQTGDDQLKDIPAEVEVKRAFALDSARHLAIGGRYPRFFALPDRWVSWWLGGVPAGLSLLKRRRAQAIFSTYPIATAHLIGLTLHKLTGLPWIADMRDPMTEPHYPPNPVVRKWVGWVERKTVQHATRIVCTTPGTIEKYRKRYPDLPADRFVLIENGFDEENFTEAEAQGVAAPAPGPLHLIHSGIVYPSERDPTVLFEALGELLARGAIGPDTLRITLRATAHDELVNSLIEKYGIGSIVQVAPHVAYRTALAEMLGAGGLLVLQASNCNQQIPAKLYEYLRARRPILALTDPIGDTAATLRAAGVDTIAPLDNKEAIMEMILNFMRLVAEGRAPLPTPSVVAANSRRARSLQLAALLDEVTASPAAAMARAQEAVR